MDPSNAQNQAMTDQSMEEMLACSKQQQEKRMKPQPEQALKCPRCDSSNTKFCYYNNYSLSQPRYFCKACRRYWTQGGTLRNIPVGGGCRKNKRSSSSKKPVQDQSPTANSTSTTPLPMLPSLTYDSNDLTLAFARLHKQPTGQLGLDDHPTSILGNTTHCDLLGGHDTTPTTTASFLDDVGSGFLDAPCILPNSYYGIGNGGIGDTEGLGGGEEMVLPFGELGSGLTTTASKQGSCKGGELENRALWGMQWQLGADGNMTTDPARDYWNGVGSSWQGLVNGPLV